MEHRWKEEYLDFVLVPTGLLILFGYHLFHLHKCINSPHSTAIGYENYNRRAWVQRILQIEAKERGQALAVIGTNTSAASSLSSISLVLSSLIGAWIGGFHQNDYLTGRIYGNKSPTLVYIKYIALLSCFLVAFACFVQTTRCFVQASFLISMPNCKMPVDDVERAVISGSNFWTVGLRALYFATSLLLWIFGPIPMFIWSIIMVLVLQYLDKNSAPLPQFKQSVSYDSLKKQLSAMNESKENDRGLEESQKEKSIPNSPKDM